MLTAGQVHELAGADTLVPGMEAEALLATKLTTRTSGSLSRWKRGGKPP
jgi:hypothetical protein